MTIIPYVIEKDGVTERTMDVYSRLLKDRIIFLGSQVDEMSANVLVAQLLFLNCADAEKPIKFYINSPGGSVSDGLAIMDTMNLIPNEVHTYCVGSACSMGALLLSAGEKGHRYILPNSRVMIHQPSGGAQGTATDIQIRIDELMKYKQKLTQILADNCNQDFDKVMEDCERDRWLDADEALEYGIVDKILDGGKK